MWHQDGAMETEYPVKTRHRLSADVPERTQARVRETASRYYRGVVSDAVTTALETFQWVVDARSRGKRVIATDVDSLPESYEELVIAGLDSIGSGEWTWLVKREHPWRRQLWIKGRNMTAGSVASNAATNGWSPERTADEFNLPVEAVLEAIRYAETAKPLIDAEEAENRFVAQRYEASHRNDTRLGAGVDRTQIRELLRLSPTERARLAAADAAALAAFDRHRS
jgi:uncharacterized protein (DUF433 family)